MKYECIKQIRTHNNKSYKKGQEISIIEYNNLSYSERENFKTVSNRVIQEVVGIGNDLNNEL